jgi:DNA ligase-associated metallophosphoesterase
MQQAQAYRNEAPPQVICVAGVSLAADPAGALWHEEARLLAVADLHFEKGSAFAMRRQMLPPYDTAATLARLAALVLHYQPKTVVALGDSFHDARAGERMARDDYDALRSLMRGRDWIWIAGNHDPQIPAGLGDMREELTLGPLVFRHEPRHGDSHGEIAGHLHPAARVVSPSGSLRRKCFVSDGTRCVLPAFGAYAGGLNIRDAAFAPLFGARPFTAHVLGRARVFAVGGRNCVGD